MVKSKGFNWREFGDFLSDHGFGIIIAMIVIGCIITGIINARKPDIPKEKAIIIELVNPTWEEYKVKFFDGVVAIKDLDDTTYVAGDTVLVER